MVKKNPLQNVVLALTTVIAIGAMVTVTTFLIQIGIIDLGLEEKPKQVPPLAQIPVLISDEGTEEPEDFTEPVTTEELIDQFLRSLGVVTVETFGVDTQVKLVDSNLEEQIENSFLKVQPLDPREVIVAPDEEIDPSRLFINTDFTTQIADNGRNYHRYSGWNVVNEPSKCSFSDGFAFNCPVPITITIAEGKNCRVENTGKCVQVSGSKNDDDDVGNNSIIHGLQKDIDISDWTRDGELTVEFDYDCSQTFQRAVQVKTTIRADFNEQHILPCVSNGHFKRDVSELVVNSNTLKVEFGGRVTSVDNFRIDIQFNNVKVEGNSVVKRQAIELLESFSIVQNDQEQRVLDLGFLELSLIGKTFNDNERTVVNGILETRIDGKSISFHDVTGNAVSSNKQLPLRIDGQNSFVFKLNEQFFDDDTFHTLQFILNDFIVNIGDGDDQRTFEYHTPFVAYTLEFNVLPDEIVAFSVNDRAISVPVSRTTFETCGLTSGEASNELEVLPPVVNIIQNGFTIATTNPSAGKAQASDPVTGKEIPNTQFCSVIPELPTGTTLTFRIGTAFYDVDIPFTQKNYFVKCDRAGCTSNIGFGGK